MEKRAEPDAPTWPQALALPCPSCNHAFEIRGLRPDGAVLFHCFTHGWFYADRWTGEPCLVDTHRVTLVRVDPAVREEFITSAVSVLLRAGEEADDVVLQSMVPDNSMQFVLFEGINPVVAQVNSRRHRCQHCGTRPLAAPQEQVLFDLGFDPIEGEENYAAGGLPSDAAALTADAKRVFHEVFEEPPGLSLWALFSRPELAEIFYLAWTYRPR